MEEQQIEAVTLLIGYPQYDSIQVYNLLHQNEQEIKNAFYEGYLKYALMKAITESYALNNLNDALVIFKQGENFWFKEYMSMYVVQSILDAMCQKLNTTINFVEEVTLPHQGRKNYSRIKPLEFSKK